MTHPLFQTMTEQPAYDGKSAQLVELTNAAGVSIVLMDIGATWLSCRLPLACGEHREVVLGVGSMTDFECQQSYMGVTVGRYANRIANGRFHIDGSDYQLVTNQAGNCLHGGVTGFDKVRWNIVEQSANKVIFSLHSADGEQGFPGNLDVSVIYQLSDDGRFDIEYAAHTDKATPINLTNHAYFNLNGADGTYDARDHQLQIKADYYLPTTDVGIPLGKLENVDNTGFDFRVAKEVNQDFLVDEQQQSAKGYDHSYWFEPNRDVTVPIARLVSQDEKVAVSVLTDKPAMQLYTGNWLAGTPARNGEDYADYAGIALETQFLPDSPNHPEWQQPSCILEPNQEYRYKTTYQITF
ncbi:galactose-1-epimerase [Vibrio sp. TBV020]|uniref:galactose-1-epimerase n=1 Tax=Vibrio sp. TBV020 TaxID=3137398 RepID=UPI0038CD5BD9